MKRLHPLSTLIFTGLLIFAATAQASTFQVAPTLLSMVANGGISSVTIFNRNDDAVNMQVRAVRWNQDKKTGQAAMSDSDMLIIFPKIFSVSAQSQKVIRVGYQGKPLDNELAFRLFIRELPVQKPGETGMRFAVRMSMPVFIKPEHAEKQEPPRITAIEPFGGQLAARVENLNNRHFKLSGLELTGSRAGKSVYTGKGDGWYVLPGVSKLFPLHISREECSKLDSLKVAVKSGAGNSEASFPVNQSLCTSIAVPESQDKTHADK